MNHSDVVLAWFIVYVWGKLIDAAGYVVTRWWLNK